MQLGQKGAQSRRFSSNVSCNLVIQVEVGHIESRGEGHHSNGPQGAYHIWLGTFGISCHRPTSTAQVPAHPLVALLGKVLRRNWGLLPLLRQVVDHELAGQAAWVVGDLARMEIRVSVEDKAKTTKGQ